VDVVLKVIMIRLAPKKKEQKKKRARTNYYIRIYLGFNQIVKINWVHRAH
jgi:hypothetical protein